MNHPVIPLALEYILFRSQIVNKYQVVYKRNWVSLSQQLFLGLTSLMEDVVKMGGPNHACHHGGNLG